MRKTGKSSESSNKTPQDDADFKERFRELPLNKKLTTPIQLEAATMSEAVNTIIDKSVLAGENVMDKLAARVSKSREKKS